MMNNLSVLAKAINKITRGKTAQDDVKPEATFKGLGLDSVGIIELILELEEKLGIEIPDDAETSDILTVGQALAYLEKVTKGASSE